MRERILACERRRSKLLTVKRKTLDRAGKKAAANPEIYGPDKYKTDNDSSYRAFEKHHYRVAYRFS